MGEGVVRFDKLAAAGSARIARYRVSRGRWEHTAQRVSCYQSSLSAHVAVQSES